MKYNFLTLSVIFAIPGLAIWSARPDLRRAIASVLPFSLPFAATEFLFYPSYWEPAFLFNLGKRFGFGLEDILFVAGLAAFTTTAYAFFCNRTYAPRGADSALPPLFRALILFASAAALLGLLLILAVPVIYSSFAAMAAAALAVFPQRADLIKPALLGGLFSAALYFLLCLAIGALMPGIFQSIWHTEKFLNVFVAGVPLEELLYGFFSGLAATAFYPYVFSRRFASRPLESPSCAS